MSTSIDKLIKIGKPFQGLAYLSLISMFVSGLAAVLPSWLIKIAIDGLTALEDGEEVFSILPKQVLENISVIQDKLHLMIDPKSFELNPSHLQITLPIMIVLVFVVEAIFKFLYQYNSRKLGLLVTKDLREKFHNHLNMMSLKSQRKYESGSLVSVVSSDLQSLQSWLAESLMNLFNESFTAFFLFAWLLVLNWKLTLLSMVTLPLFAIPVIKLGKQIRSYSRSGQDYVGTIGSYIQETLNNQRVIKAFNLEHWRQAKFIEESNVLYKLYKRWVWLMAAVSPLTNIIAAIGISVILFLGLSFVQNGTLSVGEFSSFFVTSILLYDPVKRLGRVSTIVQSALGVLDRVFMILDEPIQEDKVTAKIDQTFVGKLEFIDVNFAYADQKLFDGLNLTIEAHTSVALVGPSGGGKTSLVSLIPRFYEIDSGKILLDGINIQELSLEQLRAQIAIVTQEPLLFTGTIRDNIVLATKATETELNEAARDSYVLEFADQLPKGLDTHIGEQGNQLSIGQRQRIALARAFLSKAPIIILDEPTSALDNDSQTYVYKAIEKLMQSHTVIVIAHRLSTTKSCDRVINVTKGVVAEIKQPLPELLLDS